MSSEAKLLSLPDDLLLSIVVYLSVVDVLILRQVRDYAPRMRILIS